MNTALDNAFPDDIDEIVEGVLVRYRPIFSDTMTAFLREISRATSGTTCACSPGTSKVSPTGAGASAR